MIAEQKCGNMEPAEDQMTQSAAKMYSLNKEPASELVAEMDSLGLAQKITTQPHESANSKNTNFEKYKGKTNICTIVDIRKHFGYTSIADLDNPEFMKKLTKMRSNCKLNRYAAALHPTISQVSRRTHGNVPKIKD